MNNKKDIEEDIKKTKNYIDGWRDSLTDEDGYPKEILDEDSENFIYAIENILTDRERLKKENMKMQVEIAEQVYFESMPIEEMKQLQVKANAYDSLVEKIKEKIEELKNKLNKTYNLYGASDYEFIKLEAKIEILQELLDTEK